MAPETLFTSRKALDQICEVPDKIISVYSLEKHVWADSNSPDARKARKPELQTIEEFQIGPVRSFLTDIMKNMAAPYKREQRDYAVGQGYWIQAEFGSGKSHLLCFLSALALGDKTSWDIVDKKERSADRGKRDSLYRFWEEGIRSKNSGNSKGIFVVVKTLVGAGGGTIGLTDKGQRLSEYILDAVKNQLQTELNKNISLYPVELLADRFLNHDLDRYRKDLEKFLKDPRYFEDDEIEDINDFIKDIQQNKSPEYKRSRGNKLWRFYTEYLKVKPDIEAETEDVLRHMVESILAEGYSGVLLVLDEVSLFMKNRSEDQRVEDEKTLVVLSNRLAKVENLPIWTVCAAQQAIESRMGVKNIIADDRLKLVKLLEADKDYYDIVLSRVRTIKDKAAVSPYFLNYKRGFTWPNSIGQDEFEHFFPFHKPALEVLRHITFELTTTRSAIHFMHQTLKYQMKAHGTDLIRLWELFDEAIRYEEDPSGVHAGLVAIKTSKEPEYRAYEACKRQIDSMTKGTLKVFHDKATKVLQTLFLYHIARTRQQGLTAEEISNNVLIERDPDSTPDENVQHYESLSENMKKEMRQIVQTLDEDRRSRYRFEPVVTGIDPREEFKKARDAAESNELMWRQSWEFLLSLKEWSVRTRQTTNELAGGVKSPFCDLWKDQPSFRNEDREFEVNWQNRTVTGMLRMRDLAKLANENLAIPPIDTENQEHDYGVVIGTRPVSPDNARKLLDRAKDPRLMVWSPDELRTDERDRILNLAAYRKLVADWQGKDTEDAVTVIEWVRNALQGEMGKIMAVVTAAYSRGRVDARDHSQMEFHMAGELVGVITPLVCRILDSVYESRDIKFDLPFRNEDAVKVINGIVKIGSIPRGAKPNKDTSAATNFGHALQIMKRGADRELNTKDSRYVKDLWQFVDEKLDDDAQTMPVATLYKNFMGIGGPKNYGLSKRIVQIYILCLVREARIRILVGTKSGLSENSITYSNIEGVDFNSKVLDSILQIQKMAQPENWEVLRPYAEKLLDEPIASTHDDATISDIRAKLLKHFNSEKESVSSLQQKVTDLFDTLKVPNPYEAEFAEVCQFYKSDIDRNNDIQGLLFALKGAFEYKAFDSGESLPSEVDDFANRLKAYRLLKQFIVYEADLLTADAYCKIDLSGVDLDAARAVQTALRKKMKDLRPYIESDIRLKTELIGKVPPEPQEAGTLHRLIAEYTDIYAPVHNHVVSECEKCLTGIAQLTQSDDYRALSILEGISVFGSGIANALDAQLRRLESLVFVCGSPDHRSVTEELRRLPQHQCRLAIGDAKGLIDTAGGCLEQAKRAFNDAIDTRVESLLTPTIQSRLKQGETEPVVKEILSRKTVTELRRYLVAACLEDPSVVETVNRYLKKVVVKVVKLADFQPSTRSVEKDQIPAIASEFQAFLERSLAEASTSSDALPVLKVE